jgi:hypothetical protein
MRFRPNLLGDVLVILVLSLLPARATPEQDYLQIYLALNDSVRLERSGDVTGALAGFEDCYCRLQTMHLAHPRWEDVLVRSRLYDCRAKILALELKVKNAAPAPVGGGTAGTSTASALGSPPALMPPIVPFVFSTNNTQHSYPTVYPWKAGIVTTIFWLGKGDKASSWDPHWIRDNGGPDDEFEMSGYASMTHATRMNPFYVALPFNDLAHPDLAMKWLPKGWTSSGTTGDETRSACKDRWVEIKNRAGRYCFAQWEDVGPGSTDDAAYVFGSSRPATERGLNVSPAVAKYLGIDSSAITSWRFVDDEDVLPGMWLRYDEQALLFRAIHEQAKSSAKL